jgi:hypothetical protein
VSDTQELISILPVGEGSVPTQQASSKLDRSALSEPSVFEEARPCMAVSHILCQPSFETWESEAGGRPNGDVECSRAYQMVMPFATSNDKMEAISLKLKEGCSIDKERGGCKVKANVMWEVLDNAMNQA